MWFLVFGFVMFHLLSCDVEEIPETDNEPPEFTLTIQGDGVNQTFTPRDNFDEIQLNLLKDATYDFTFLGADAGGVELTVLFAHLQSLDFSDLASDVERVENEFKTTISKSGDINNALTALSMTGKIELIGNVNESFTLELEVHDFASPANSTYASLHIFIVDDPDMVGL